MELNFKLERKLIETLAAHEKNEKFIRSTLRLLNNDEKRIALLDYLDDNVTATRKEIEEKMFYITITDKGVCQ